VHGYSASHSGQPSRSSFADRLQPLKLRVAPVQAPLLVLLELIEEGLNTIAHGAAISANNDRLIGDLIAAAMDKVGREGAVSIEDGSGLVASWRVRRHAVDGRH